MQLRPCAKAGIHKSPALQLLQGSVVKFCPLTLKIGFVSSVKQRTFVPAQSQPEEVLHHLLGIAPGTTGGVQIFDPQYNLAALLFGAEPRQKTTENIPQVNASARGGGKTSNRHTRLSLSQEERKRPKSEPFLIRNLCRHLKGTRRPE